jgi:hypothetical protein
LPWSARQRILAHDLDRIVDDSSEERKGMQVAQSTVSLNNYKGSIVAALQDAEYLVVVDTNVLAWSFRLNDAAHGELMRWLGRLAEEERLAVPAWAVHEYNHHLLQDDDAFFLPHRSVGKQLLSNLSEIDRVAHLMFSEKSASELGYANKEALLAELRSAAAVINKCVTYLARHGADQRHSRILSLEGLLAKAALKSPVQELASAALSESAGRYSNRLSPGYRDGHKTENSCGDLIIWKELLDTCAARGIKKAVLVSNDQKPDWVYTPRSVILPNDKVISGTSEKARFVRLPKPDLLDEFERRTGGEHLHFYSTEAVFEVLSSAELNARDAQDFRHLAMALRIDLGRTPTEAIVQWFLKNPDAIGEAISGVCYWADSPSEVDMKGFESWAAKRIDNVDPQTIDWVMVFCELFL